ncbi:MAG: hypothetical protein CVU84_08535 [Firmicutes bacterium HGW-Firmicutes-1]|jgi:acyl transferase domain-containing protein/aryl carrier-like protein|nr:MAG: hypothetical protein CVU84_08535 [Firmicutes bacterium HGW-Firmicutes-1]
MHKETRDIIELIKDKKITPEEGFKRIKANTDQISENHYYLEQWQQLEESAIENTRLLKGNILLFDVDQQFCNAIREYVYKEMGSNDIKIVLVMPGSSFGYLENDLYEVNIKNSNDYKSLLDDLEGRNVFPETILHMWSKDNDSTSFKSRFYKGIDAIFYLAKELVIRKIKSYMSLMYFHQGHLNDMQPQYASVASFLRTLNMENPYLKCKSICMEESVDIHSFVKIIGNEMAVNLTDIEICYDERLNRYVRGYKLYTPTNQSVVKPVLKNGGTYIITGGAGSIGLIIAGYIASKVKCHIALTGRSTLSQEKQDILKKLEENGSEVVYFESDITSKKSVQKLIGDVKIKFDKIDGIIHSAGILRDSFLFIKTKKDFDKVLAPKIYGTFWLDEVTKDEELDFFVLFSSVSATLGNVGQTDYAYANSFMDYYAKKRELMVNQKQRWGKSISINWPYWSDGGMTINEKTLIWLKENMGILPLSSENGIKAFEDALNNSFNQLIVFEGDEKKISQLFSSNKQQYIDESQDALVSSTTVSITKENIDQENIDQENINQENINQENTNQENIDSDHIVLDHIDPYDTEIGLDLKDKAELVEKTKNFLKPLISKETKVPLSKIDSEADFEKFGLDSVMIMGLNRELENNFGELSKTLFYENQTIGQLAHYLVQNYEDKVVEKLSGSLKQDQRDLDEENKNIVSHSITSLKRQMNTKTFEKNKVTILEQLQNKQNNECIEDDIAIIGLSGKYPMASTISDFWENLKSGKDCITQIPTTRWDYTKYFDANKNAKGKTYSKWGGFIEDVDKFDPLFFNISPREACYIDPQERIFLETAWHTLEDGGYTRDKISEENIGVFVGAMFGHYQLFGAEESMRGNDIGLSSSFASIANRVSYILNLKGPSIALDTMCSSSLTAIHIAKESILRGECDVAIAGGVNVTIHPNKYILLSQSNFPSTDGKCRSFGDGGDGYVPGEGTGAVLLKPLKKAIADGDHIYGVIKGSALNHGGKTSGYSVPNPNAQASLISKALLKAGIEPRTISYIEAHGTGTALGDPIEITGLVHAFQKSTKDKQFCAIGSVKSNIGHCESAAGIAGLTKVLLQMQYKQLVPSIHSAKLNANIKFENTPFTVQQRLEEWKQPDIEGKKYLRRAGISSFGAGGSNAHILVEEYIYNELEYYENREQLIVLSARNEERLLAYSQELIRYLMESFVEQQKYGRTSLEQIAYTLQVGREAMTERLGIIASSIEELIEKLEQYLLNNLETDNLYLGTVKEKSGMSDQLDDDDEGQAFVFALIKNKKLNKLAKLWVTGVEVDWKTLYNNTIRRVSLPTYPFAKVRYWVPEQEGGAVEAFHNTQNIISKLHPMIDQNISTIDEQMFSTTFSGEEFFLKDHVIEGKMILPGVAYIEMARAAGELSGVLGITKIKDILWIRPITIHGPLVEVHIGLYPKEDSLEYEISTRNNDQIIVHSQGRLLFEDENFLDLKEEKVDIETIIQRCTETISSEVLYQRLGEAGFTYGKHFQPITKIVVGEGEALAYLQLSNNGIDTLEEFKLHPSLMDGALQSVAGLSKDEYLPFALGEVDILRELKEKCYAHVCLTLDTPSIKKYCINLLDEEGEVLVRLKDFSLRAFKPKTIQAQKATHISPNTQIETIKVENQELSNSLQKDIVHFIANIVMMKEIDIDINKDMSRFGFDSISFTELSNKFNEKYKMHIMPSLFYEHETILSLIKYLLKEYKELLYQYYSDSLNEDHYKSKIPLVTEDSAEDSVEQIRSRYRALPYIAQTSNLIGRLNEPIAIIGLSGVMPGSDTLEEYWNNIEAGKDLITEIPEDRWDWRAYYGDPMKEPNKTNVKWGGFMKEVDKFDSRFFEISPREAELMDPQQRIFLQTVWKAIEDAGYSPKEISGTKTGVFVGVGTSDYGDLLKENNIEIKAQITTGLSNCIIANRISYLLNFHGPSEPIDTACSSSLVAVHRAVEAIQLGNCEMAIAGGVSVIASPSPYIALSKAAMICEDGRCKTFDKHANGYVRGEGSGAILLKPLSKAIDDHDHIYAVIKGSDVNHGGHVNSMTTPNPNAQAEVIVKAWKKSGIDPSTIGYIEAHGSGTSLGDPIEINGLKKAFSQLYLERGKTAQGKPYCGIGSVKTNVGHLETAAGIAGLLKVVLAMKNKKIPPTIHFNELNPYIELGGSPFYIAEDLKVWEKIGNEPRRAGVSSFGFGGTNAHVVLEEYEMPQYKLQEENQKQIIILSAKNKNKLQEYASEMIRYLDTICKEVHNLPYDGQLIQLIESDLIKLAAEIMNVSQEEISIHESLDVYGFDPVRLIEFRKDIDDKFGMENTILLTRQYLSIKEIALIIYNQFQEGFLDYYRDKIVDNRNAIKENISLRDIAFTLQVGREEMSERLAVVVSDKTDLKEKLCMFVGERGDAEKLYLDTARDSKNKMTFIMDGEEGREFLYRLIKEKKIEKIAQLWVSGTAIDWKLLYENRLPRRLSLPTYPFARDRYWLPEQKEKPKVKNIVESKAVKDDVLYYTSSWENCELDEHLDNKLPISLLVFDSGKGIFNLTNAEGEYPLTALKGHEKEAFNEVILVHRGETFKELSKCEYEVNPLKKEDYVKLFEILKEKNQVPTHLLYLWNYLEEITVEDIHLNEAIGHQLETSAYSLLHLCHGLIEKKWEKNIKIIYAYNSTMSENISQYEAVSGLLKTVCLENARISYKTIMLDMDPKNIEDLRTLLIEELMDESAEVMHQDGRRSVKILIEKNVTLNKGEYEDKKSLLRDRGVYIITGGAGGLGLIFAEYLARNYRARLVLTGRSELEISKQVKLESFKKYGAEVIYVRTDVSKQEEVENLIDEAKRNFTQINGIIHSAGVIRDAYLIKKTDKEMKEVLLPKVYGTVLLDEITKNDNLDFFVLFSSIAAVFGNPGQGDYAYANGFLDSFSHKRADMVKKKERYGKSISVNWPLWQHGNMQVDQQIEQMMENSLGIRLLQTHVGIDAFEFSLTQESNQLMVLQGNKNKINSIIGKTIIDNRKEKVEISIKDLMKKLQKVLMHLVSDILKIPLSDIQLDEDLSQFGFDSISFIEFANQLNEKYDLAIVPSIFYEYSTLESFAKHLTEAYKDLLGYHLMGNNKLEGRKAEFVEPFTEETLEIPEKEGILAIEGQGMMDRFKDPVAIVGICGVFPQSDTLEEFWDNLQGEKDLISEIPKDRWDWKEYYGNPLREVHKTNIKWGGFMKEVDKFDPLFFGISPREAELMDPQQRIFLQIVWKTIEDAGYRSKDISGTNTGVFVGVGNSDYSDLIKEHKVEIQAQISTGLSHSVIANRISYLLNLRGPSEPIDTACSSSLTAVHRAVESIQLGHCDMAIAGGISVLVSPTPYIALSKAGMLSEDGRCKTFDKNANGYVRGEGAGAVLLKSLSQAVADGNHIYAVIKGSALNHGGHVNSLTTPNPIAQAEVILKAWKKAEVDPTTIGYIEAHGTGTSLGDPIEINGLKKAFEQYNKELGKAMAEKPYCGIGSVKTNIGHLEAAAGIAGLFKVILSMQYKKIPASINWKELNPYIQLEGSPMYIVQSTQEWEKIGDEKRRAGVSSFGYAGTNAHVLLEEYEAPKSDRGANCEPYIFVLSAKSDERLKAYIKEMVRFIDCNDEKNNSISLENMAYTLQVGRDTMTNRLSVVVSTFDELKDKLKRFLNNEANIEGLYRGHANKNKELVLHLFDGEAGKEFIKNIIKNREYENIAQLWVNGYEMNWNLLKGNTACTRVSLPTYPFEQERYWLSKVKSNDQNDNDELLQRLRDIESGKLDVESAMRREKGESYES